MIVITLGEQGGSNDQEEGIKGAVSDTGIFLALAIFT